MKVHPSYRSRGYANELHGFLISYREVLSRRGAINSMMYATHIKSRASVHLGHKRGFRIANRFYHLTGEVSGDIKVNKNEPVLPTLDLVPVGWRFIKRCNESLDWLKRNVISFGMDEGSFFAPKGISSIFMPSNYLKVEDLMEGMGSVAARFGRRIGLMIPEELPQVAEKPRKRGFSQWTGQEPDVLVFELVM